MSTTITNLLPDHIDDAASLLAEATLMDPLPGYIFGSDLDIRRRAWKATLAMLLRLRIGQDETVLAAIKDGELAAVASFALPGRPSWPVALHEDWSRMEGAIGGDATDRFAEYRELHQRHDLETGHIYLDVLGVHRDHRGEGLSTLLLDHVGELAANHGHSIGIALDTANAANLEFYRERGFGVKATDWLGRTQVYFLFKGN